MNVSSNLKTMKPLRAIYAIELFYRTSGLPHGLLDSGIKRYHCGNITNQDILKIRSFQTQQDSIIGIAYGWTDIDFDHGFHEVGYLPANDNIRYTIRESAHRRQTKQESKNE